jgi:hypothetical protein
VTAVAAPPYVQDPTIWPGLDALATCLCQEVIRAGIPSLCFCGVVAGQVAFDVTDDDRGMAWVRVVQAYPSTSFPQPAIGVRSCLAPLVAELEIGLVHCFPASKDPETVPTEQDQWDAAMLQQADMMVLYRAIQCCYGKFDEYAVGIYQPIGPDGGWVGGTWQVWISGWKGR